MKLLGLVLLTLGVASVLWSVLGAWQAARLSRRRRQVEGTPAPFLARAVIELTARLDAERFAHANAAMRIKCVEALAEKYEATARDMGSGSYGGALAAKIAQAIRTALNGDNA